MRRIAHLSDLHFGAHESALVGAVLEDVRAQHPQLIVVSGDLTQRARASQFADARRFLDALPAPAVVVPGNHDIPLYNVIARFGWSLANYRRHIAADLTPSFVDDELAVASVNTARSNTWKDGRVAPADIERLRQFFAAQPDRRCKILVAHHPFIPPTDDATAALVGRAGETLRMLAACGCHLVLAGHLHQAYAGDVRPHHVEVDRAILVIQAGTAVSHRRRGEANAYNLLEIDGPRLELKVRAWDGVAFIPRAHRRWEDCDEGWVELGGEAERTSRQTSM
jgi:3',5'-cyclic AMP phosphodiesterase CpdA